MVFLFRLPGKIHLVSALKSFVFSFFCVHHVSNFHVSPNSITRCHVCWLELPFWNACFTCLFVFNTQKKEKPQRLRSREVNVFLRNSLWTALLKAWYRRDLLTEEIVLQTFLRVFSTCCKEWIIFRHSFKLLTVKRKENVTF